MDQSYDEYEAEQDYDQCKAYMSPQDYEEYQASMNRQNERNLSLWMLRSNHRLEQFQHYQRLMDLSAQQNQHVMCMWKLHNDSRWDLLQCYQCLQQRQCQQVYQGSQDDVNKIFSENIDHLVEKMTQYDGSRFVQWLLNLCDENHRQQIIDRITSEPVELVWISYHPYGLASLSLSLSLTVLLLYN
ncbi:hypothetical protein FH972_009583 [Carpinus fangiana]|uniref:PUM-HD domain-containing protein n=1 Tax=Carpinus fangiana TaxID=176857 RepID=A0A660KKS4_9ROSI|nr:hypothetical protein FH972_009583 [Carpinus fangiana]